MINELDIYLNLTTYISHVWRNEGKETAKSKTLLRQIKRVVKNESLIKPTLPYISQTEVHSQIKEILSSFQYQNKQAIESVTRENLLRAVHVNADQTINEVLIRLDDKIDSATQTIRYNKELIIINQKATNAKLDEDTSYEIENKYSLSLIEQLLINENKKLESNLQSVEKAIEGIESLLALHKKHSI